MAPERDPQERLRELRVAIGADLQELGSRWRRARQYAHARRWPLAAAAGVLGNLMRRPRRAPPRDPRAGA